jgi:hypothetical protein
MKIKRWRKKAQNREEWASVRLRRPRFLKDRRAKKQAILFTAVRNKAHFVVPTKFTDISVFFIK